MRKLYKFREGTLQLFLGRTTVWIFYPKVYLKFNHIGVYAPTVLNLRFPNDWQWSWSGAMQIIGLGLGVSFNHVDNPNYKQPGG